MGLSDSSPVSLMFLIFFFMPAAKAVTHKVGAATTIISFSVISLPWLAKNISALGDELGDLFYAAARARRWVLRGPRAFGFGLQAASPSG